MANACICEFYATEFAGSKELRIVGSLDGKCPGKSAYVAEQKFSWLSFTGGAALITQETPDRSGPARIEIMLADLWKLTVGALWVPRYSQRTRRNA
jgi:hypothetical protein